MENRGNAQRNKMKIFHAIVATIKQNCIMLLFFFFFSRLYNYRKWNLRSIKLFSNAMFPEKSGVVMHIDGGTKVRQRNGERGINGNS